MEQLLNNLNRVTNMIAIIDFVYTIIELVRFFLKIP